MAVLFGILAFVCAISLGIYNKVFSIAKYDLFKRYEHFQKHGNIDVTFFIITLQIDYVIATFQKIPPLEENKKFYSYPKIQELLDTIETTRRPLKISLIAFCISVISFITAGVLKL